MKYRCVNRRCKSPIGSTKYQCLSCGVEAPLPIRSDEDEIDDRYVVKSLYKTRDLPTIELASPLSPGGKMVARGMLLVGGVAGAGKSTVAAALGLALCRKFKWSGAWKKIGWVDAEQSASEVRQVFDRSGMTRAESKKVRRYRCPTLESLLAAIDDGDERYCVVDSLHVLTDNPGDVREIVDACVDRAKRSLVVVIAHSNAKGAIRGTTYAKHKCRAVFRVKKTVVRVEKCRWSPEQKIKRPRVSRETKKSPTS